VPTIQFSLSEVIASLNAKISDLQASKKTVEQEIARGNHVQENNACVKQINDSLAAATTARNSMQDSCCTTQSCNFEYYA
jgi:hypothetical protein